MQSNKFVATLMLASAFLASVPAEAGSIGRSSSGSSMSRSSSSSSFSRPSTPSPSKPSVAPAPSNPGGIGGNSASMGVRKNEVTAPVAKKVEQSRPSAVNPDPGKAGSFSVPTTTPSYSAPAVPAPQVTNGSMFMSSLGGSFVGSAFGNMLFGGHGSHGGGTTVINNGTPSGGSSGGGGVSGASAITDSGGVYSTQPVAPVTKSYTMWNFIGDLISFVILVALLVGIAWLFYKGYKMIRSYVNRERGVGPSQPFSPTAKFWEIQRAFAAADLTALTGVLGPDLVDEATRDLVVTELTLRNVSHEVVLNNPREFSVHYTFVDGGETINQVWHYEKHESVWKLNGIENV